MNWETIQAAIQDWAATQSGLTAIWANQGQPRVTYPYVILNIVSEHQNGIDEIRYTENAGKLDPYVCGIRHFTVSCAVDTLSNLPNAAPRNAMAALRASLRKPKVLDLLSAAGVAVIHALDSHTQDYEGEGKLLSRVTMDVQFSTASNVGPLAGENLDYIATVDGEGTFDPHDLTIEGPWGDI